MVQQTGNISARPKGHANNFRKAPATADKVRDVEVDKDHTRYAYKLRIKDSIIEGAAGQGRRDRDRPGATAKMKKACLAGFVTSLADLHQLEGLTWISHWLEMHSDPEFRIGRPRQIYTGHAKRDYPS